MASRHLRGKFLIAAGAALFLVAAGLAGAVAPPAHASVGPQALLVVAGLNYPRPAPSFPLPMPAAQPTMPDPCAGVPANPWCPARR
jgi:hypothetical protein